ncbi:MAG: alpha/beta hydrolase [Phreatobacter sp.]|uniref:esterase/lipase family protein n=1 Tax=Phreatobacter sp. TaxID=1966341 RepID=UPI0027369753|nr:alpha/beta hydrolase [Phreatobacter sp.]MDP2804246.1 alpha/beta hydrolase [Phreatobacter sp.]
MTTTPTRRARSLPPSSPEIPPPPLRYLAMEMRSAVELAELALRHRTLSEAPRGDGHPVLVLPGLMSSDLATLPMRRFLTDRGYAAYGWGFGMNLGLRGTLEADLADLLGAIAARHGRKVSLVGISLGGIYARQLAKVLPHLARSVVTLGSPFAGSPRSTRGWRVYEWACGQSVDTRDEHMGGPVRPPPPVPTTAIYSRTDGICAWQSCVEPDGPMSESIEVTGSHIGLPHNLQVLRVLADRLAQREGEFTPYQAAGPAAEGPLHRHAETGAPAR